MHKIALMDRYFVSENGAEQLLKKLNVATNFRNQLRSLGLISESINLNSLYRVLRRCMRIVSDQLSSAHLDLGILVKKEEDIYFGVRGPFEFEESDWPLEIKVEWLLYLQKIFELSLKNPELRLENFIPEVVSKVPALSVSIIDKDKISLKQFKEYINSLRTRGRTIQGRKSRLLNLVQSGHGDLFSRISDSEEDADILGDIQGIQELRVRECSGAPLAYEGLLTKLDCYNTHDLCSLHPDERLPRHLGFDKTWYRKRKALVAFLNLTMSPERLINFWGMFNFMQIEFGQGDSGSPLDPIDDQIKTSIDWVEGWLTQDRQMVSYYLNKTEKDNMALQYYSSKIHKYRSRLMLMNDHRTLATEYFKTSYAIDAPSDWFDQ